MPKSDALQASLKVAAVGGIFMAWAKFTIDAFKFSWHIISTSPETLNAVTKAVCGNCQELYDDDEYHLIHGTHLCEACRSIEKIIFKYIMASNFFGNVFVGALAGGVFTATAIVIKNNMAASARGALVGSLIAVAAYCGKNEFQIQRL